MDPVVSAVSANGFIPGSSDGREYFITELFDSAAPEIATCDDHGVAGRERTTVEGSLPDFRRVFLFTPKDWYGHKLEFWNIYHQSIILGYLNSLSLT